MLKSYERLCACGCGMIININESNYILKENVKRNCYYDSKYHLPKRFKGIEDYVIEKGCFKRVNNKN